ncbi:MAG: sodium-dependent transporter [bacterium]
MLDSGGTQRETWGSKFGFILAASGSAIGLGNIWRFPYVLGESGGFAFLLVYIICVIIIGLPIMGAEMVIGRASGLNPVGAFRKLAPRKLWWVVGAVGVITGIIILSYYSVVAGWTIAYLLKSATGFIAQMATAGEASAAFDAFLANSPVVVFYHVIFMGLCLLVVSQGVQGGIERWSKILMPTLFVLLLLLIFRSVTLPGAGTGLSYLFNPDFSKLNGEVILQAMGQAFYSLSLGMGVMITYGSYLDRKTNVFSSSVTIAALDTGIALLAGIAIFPAVFAMGFAPAESTGLTFKVLPLVFHQLPFGALLSTLFFILLTIAAVTSAISLLEVMVSFASDELGWRRSRAAIVMALAATLLGIPSALSFGVWSGLTLFGKNFFGLADALTANILLPVGGIMISLFAGWFWGRDAVREEYMVQLKCPWMYDVWLWSVRLIAPLAVAVVLANSLFGL